MTIPSKEKYAKIKFLNPQEGIHIFTSSYVQNEEGVITHTPPTKY